MEHRADKSPQTAVTIFVCKSCGAETDAPLAGEKILAALRNSNREPDKIAVTGVDCLAVCERPVTVSFAAPGKWTYIVGDIDTSTSPDDILAAARAVATSPYGVPAMAERPDFFRNGVVARTPPHGWDMPQ